VVDLHRSLDATTPPPPRGPRNDLLLSPFATITDETGELLQEALGAFGAPPVHTVAIQN
jgi:hypothetical protein